MKTNTHEKLFEKNLINEKQFNFLNLVKTSKLISVYYELQIILYVGVLLFASGIGILIYKNIGQIGHIVSLILLFLANILSFIYVYKQAFSYSNSKVEAPTPYFDYVLLLASLLLISVQGYLQFLFGFLNNNLELSSLFTALIFFYLAYRYDNLGILSLAITSFAAFWGLSISPQKWYSANFFSFENFHIVGIVFSISMAILAFYLNKNEIKKHFTFTYLNFSSLIFNFSVLTGVFTSSNSWFYLILLALGCYYMVIFAKNVKSFLFLLYTFIFAYIGTTYILYKIIESSGPQLFMLAYFYPIISCGGFIYFIIKYKNYFKEEQ